MSKQFLLTRFICEECEFELFVPDGQIPEFCPGCRSVDTLSDSETVKAEQWSGEELQ